MSLDAWVRRTRAPEPAAVARGLVAVAPEDVLDVGATVDPDLAPVLCVTGDPAGASAFQASWLGRIAAAGHYAAAVSVRGQGNTPDAEGGLEAFVNDVVQAATAVPRQTVLVGHGLGAAWAAHAAARYPAAALVLLAPAKVVRTPFPGVLRKPEAPPKPVGSPPVCLVVAESEAQSKQVQALTDAYGVAPLTFPGAAADVFKGPSAEGLLDAVLSWLDRKE
jgi:pimeloyl-ACP methyl ester carboxylesterase